MGTSNTTTCATENHRACLRRVTVGVVIALMLGIGFSALGGFMAGDFASINETPDEQTYLVTLPDDEEMLRTLSQQLMTSAENTEASALSDIAPAAGAPLGTFGE